MREGRDGLGLGGLGCLSLLLQSRLVERNVCSHRTRRHSFVCKTIVRGRPDTAKSDAADRTIALGPKLAEEL